MNSKIPWLAEPALQRVFAATRKAGGEARAVGGVVRDFLLGASGGDVDIASSLPPEKTIAIARREGWKAVPTGIAHGTVTLVLPGRTVEVTTLRRDVETDGRHATVAFTDRFEEDAARRDFTINALYMGSQGEVYDYFGGREDLHARCLRFIGDAATRIAEDGLRMLRYFRFLAMLGWEAEEEALKACAASRGMIAQLSGERIAQEMRKLLSAPNPAYALKQMQACGLSDEPMLKGVQYSPALENLLAYERDYGFAVNPWLRLMVINPVGKREAIAKDIGKRWKLSRAEMRFNEAVNSRDTSPLLFNIAAARPFKVNASQVKAWLRAEAREVVIGRIVLAAIDRTLKAPLPELLGLVQNWEIPKFPVTAKDLLALGYSEGPKLGAALKALEHQWRESDYRLDKADLLKQL